MSLDDGLFGRYRLVRLLGHGGMAAVYLAHQEGLRGFSKKVALKIVHAHLASQKQFTRYFINEARLGGYLLHPNIVQTLDFGEVDGRVFLAMEFVDGPTVQWLLSSFRSRGMAIPVDVALQIVIGVCQALDFAHAAVDHHNERLNMIHRDLKPSNILVSRFGHVKLGDFGVARAECNLDRTLTAGTLKGTVRYMSPEQAWGVLDLDHRADLFAVGSVLFELLAMEHLYNADTTEAAIRQAQEAKVEHRFDAIPDSPVRDDLVSFLRKALARAVDERFQSAGQMAEHLGRIRNRIETPMPLQKWMARLGEEAGAGLVHQPSSGHPTPLAKASQAPTVLLEGVQESRRRIEALGKRIESEISAALGGPPERGETPPVPVTPAGGNTEEEVPGADVTAPATAGDSVETVPTTVMSLQDARECIDETTVHENDRGGGDDEACAPADGVERAAESDVTEVTRRIRAPEEKTGGRGLEKQENEPGEPTVLPEDPDGTAPHDLESAPEPTGNLTGVGAGSSFGPGASGGGDRTADGLSARDPERTALLPDRLSDRNDQGPVSVGSEIPGTARETGEHESQEENATITVEGARPFARSVRGVGAERARLLVAVLLLSCALIWWFVRGAGQERGGAGGLGRGHQVTNGALMQEPGRSPGEETSPPSSTRLEAQKDVSEQAGRDASEQEEVLSSPSPGDGSAPVAGRGKQDVRAAEGIPRSRRSTAPRRGHGQLNAASLPASTIVVDGRPLEEFPVRALRLVEGVHRVSFVAPGGEMLHVRVAVTPGETVRCWADFKTEQVSCQ